MAGKVPPELGATIAIAAFGATIMAGITAVDIVEGRYDDGPKGSTVSTPR